ncbi:MULTISPECIES: hypothetical protein [unclassified Burkholderia]|uniref:hypothetical protein n=1 Tax=unclassified Burkholderia TaxID=2613784 RepID=UPI0021AB98B0|nr:MULTISPECIES: hypothetical protein [unclassified Burkholderia]
MGTSTAILRRAGHSHRYPGSIVTAEDMPARLATPHPAVIECADGSGATATRSPLEDDALELQVDEYVTRKRHRSSRTADCCGRSTRRAPRGGSTGGFLPPDASGAAFGGNRARGAKIRRLGIHDEQAF